MTSPAHLAVVHVLNDHGTEQPDHCARQILDALRDHGWRPPPTAEPIPPAGRSTDETRRRARALVLAAIRDAKVRGGRL